MFTVTCRELLLSSSERSYVSLELGVQTNEMKRSGWFGRAQLGITQYDAIRVRTLRISEILYCLTKQETIGHILKMAKVTRLKSSPQLHTNSSRARELIFPKDINAYLSADQPPLCHLQQDLDKIKTYKMTMNLISATTITYHPRLTNQTCLTTFLLELTLQPRTLPPPPRSLLPTQKLHRKFHLELNFISTQPSKNKLLKLEPYSNAFKTALCFPSILYMIQIMIIMPMNIKTLTALQYQTMTITMTIMNPAVTPCEEPQKRQHLALTRITIIVTILIIIIIIIIIMTVLIRSFVPHKVSIILTLPHLLLMLKICYEITRKEISQMSPSPFQKWIHYHHAPSPTSLLRFMSRAIVSKIWITLHPLQLILHGSFRPILLLIIRIPTTIPNLNSISLLTQSQKKLKAPGYGGQPILKRMDGSGYSTNQANPLTFPVQFGKQWHITNSWNSLCSLKTLFKILPKPTTIHLTQTLMMIHGQWSSYNHHRRSPLTMTLPSKDRLADSLTISIFPPGMSGTWLGNCIQIWSSSYIHIELVNSKDIFPYSQSFPKISICKQSCDTTVTGESNWRKREIQHYSIGNLLWKGDTSPQPRLEYNTYLDKRILITAHQALGLQYQRQYTTKEPRSARTSTERMVAREIFADSNTSALYAASSLMASSPATRYNKTNQHKYKPLLQNLTQMPQNISISQTISNQTSSPPISTMSLGPTSTFRSYNNNIVWINHDTPEATLDSPSYVTPNYQWKAAKDLTQLGLPETHSITLSLTAEPPLDHPLTPQEAQIMKKLDH